MTQPEPQAVFAALLGHSRDGLLLLGEDGAVLQRTEQAVALLRDAGVPVMPARLLDVLHPDDHDAVLAPTGEAGRLRVAGRTAAG